MKQTILLLVSLLLLVFNACDNQVSENEYLKTEVDSLKTALNNTYRPGLGEFMSSIQMHHAKLWFAGINNNWHLADFEINEIKEVLVDIQTYCTDRPEAKEIKMIYPSVDSVSGAIKLQSIPKFQECFRQMTNMCNECHSITSHAFNVITIPNKLPVVNQSFKVH